MSQTLITKAFELHEWITQRLDGLDISRERRVLLAVSCYDVVIEHHVGIVVLLRSRINGSAFALVRPLFETFVRGVWLRHCATDEQIDLYVGDKLGLKFWQLLQAVEKVDGFEGKVLSGLKKNAWDAMNSYTHGGIRQAERRTNGAYIEPAFSLEEIVEIIKLAGSFALLAFQQIADEAKRTDLANEALEKLSGVGQVQ
ncbi:MAG: hypothetical protein NTX31_01325 [Burkholderiales bacterium]|nr:hypothetical protein [Burkholderiales bacterium]